MGFASGLRAGSSTGKEWVNNYKNAKTERISNELFKVGHNLQQEGEEINAEGEAIKTAGMDFLSMSQGDIANAMMEQVVANGGKIDDQTYKLAYATGGMFQQVKQKGEEYANKKSIFDAKMNNYQSILSNRNRRTQIAEEKSRRPRGGGRKSLTDGYKIDKVESGVDPYDMDTATQEEMSNRGYGTALETSAKQIFKKSYSKLNAKDKASVKRGVEKERPLFGKKYGYTPQTKKKTEKKTEKKSANINPDFDKYFN